MNTIPVIGFSLVAAFFVYITLFHNDGSSYHYLMGGGFSIATVGLVISISRHLFFDEEGNVPPVIAGVSWAGFLAMFVGVAMIIYANL